MRRIQPCAKCDSPRVLFLTRLADLVGVRHVGKMVATRELARVVNPDPDPARGAPLTIRVGVLQAYVCPACGYVELYTKHPEGILVDGVVIQEVR